MDFLIAIIAVTVALAEVQGKILNPENQMLNNFQFPPHSSQQSYATREIILFLTPSQIRALQEGKGLPNAPQVLQADKHTQAQAYSQALQPENERFPPYSSHPQPLKKPATEEIKSDKFVPINPPSDYRQPENQAHNNFQAKPKRILRPIPFFPDLSKEVPNNEPKSLPAPIPQVPVQDKDPDQIMREQLKEQWLQLLLQNIAHYKSLVELSQKEKPNENKHNFHYLTQNNNKHASDVYNLVRSNNERQLENQRSLLQAEAVANLPSVLVHKEINMKHTPAHLIAHVPVRTPVFIPIQEPVMVPQTYSGPLDLLRTVPVPTVNHPVPFEIKKHIPLSMTKNMYVDRAHYVARSVPQVNPVNMPIHNHEWHH